MHIPRFRLSARLLLWALAALCLLPGVVRAEEEGSEGRKELPDENTIYIPYKDLKKALDREGGGVFLPYRTFIKLWQKSHPPSMEGVEKPALAAAVTAAKYTGSVDKETATFGAEYQVQVFRKGWTAVPFQFKGLAISKVHEGDGRSVLTATKKGYSLLVPEPGIYRLKVDFVVKVSEKDGRKSFSIQTPAASLSRFQVDLPGTSLKVDLKPNLAATTEEQGERTRVFAFLGAADRISVEWEPKIKREAVKKAFVFADVKNLVKIEEGVIESTATVDFKILQAPAPAFAVAFPADFQVIKIDGPNIREWNEEKRGEEKILRVTLHTPQKDAYRFSLHLEKITRETRGEIRIPRLWAQGVERETGIISVAVVPPYKAKVIASSGLSQIDLKDIPKAIKPRDTAFGFKYLKQPVDLKVGVDVMEPEIQTVTRSRVHIKEHLVTFSGHVQVKVEKAGIFGMRWTVPEGYAHLRLTQPGLVRDHRVTQRKEKKDQVIDIQFFRKTEGQFAIPFELSLKRDKMEGTFSLPWVKIEGAKKQEGYTAVAVAEGFAVTSDEAMTGFTPAEDELRRIGMGSFNLGFKYLQADDLKADLTIEKLKAQITARVDTAVDVKEGSVRIWHTIHYSIRRAAVKEFTFSLPVSIDPKEVEVDVPDWAETRKDTEKEEGRTLFKVLVRKKVKGALVLKVTHDYKIGDLAVGRPSAAEIPDLRVHEVFQWNGFIAVLKGDNVVIEEKTADGVEVKDPKDLPEALRGKNPFLAYWYQSYPYKVALNVIKYDYQEMITTVVNAMHVEAFLTKEKELNCYAILEVRTKQAQFLRLRMPPGAEFQEPVRLGTHLIRPSRTEKTGTENEYLIDLSKVKAQEGDFHVTMHYLVSDPKSKGLAAIEAGYTVEAPAVLPEGGSNPEGGGPSANPPPVNRLTLDFFFPDDYRVLSVGSEMIRLSKRSGVWADILDAVLGESASLERQAAAVAREIAALKIRAGFTDDRSMQVGRKKYSFYKTSAGGRVSVAYMSWGFFYFINLLFLVAAGTALIVLPFLKVVGRSPVLLGFAAGCLLISAVSEALSPFAGTVFLATLLSALFWLGYFVWESFDQYRTQMIEARRDGPGKPEGPRGGRSKDSQRGKGRTS
jgi:hypothetical protein